MVEVKYLLILLVLIIGGYFGYSSLPKGSVGPLNENECKQLLMKHDPSIADMSFYTAGREYHIDNSPGNTTMKYNVSGDKQVFFVSGDDFEGCGISTASENMLKGNYKEYLCSKEGISKLFVETKETENYFYVNYKVVSGIGASGKILYVSQIKPQFKLLVQQNIINKMMDFYGCE